MSSSNCLMLLLAFGLLSALVVEAHEEPLLIEHVTSDLIRQLPGQPKVSFEMFSGYIVVDEEAGRSLFYWFVEADVANAESAPLTLWLNGGPGCSSIGGGALSELGPFFPDKDGLNLQNNPYSWNKISNLIFLESPAGVGFSYSNNTEDYVTGDARTAEDTYTFLRGFLKLYPQYTTNRFYIAGESYAGHYVPQLAALIVAKNKQDPAINFVGIAVGNAWTDTNIDNYGAVFFWWSHALISDSSFQGILKSCNFSEVGPLSGVMQRTDDENCVKYVEAATYELGPINIYEIYADICLSAHARHETVHFVQQLNSRRVAGIRLHPLTASNSYDPCVDNEVQEYLNRPDVQQALHANITNLPYRWTDCSDVVKYSDEDLLSSVLPLYKILLEANLQILIFSGDVDAIVPVTGTRGWLSTLNLTIKREWRPWLVNNQVGGYVTEYDGLTFATVRDAGHMVPYTQPARAFHLFHAFISNSSL